VPLKVNRTDPVVYTQQDVDNLQLMRTSPILHLRTVLLQFVQGLFWYMPRGNYHWEPNVTETEIVITDESPIKVKDYGTRPCMTITRSSIVLSSLGLDDMAGFDMQTGTKKKSVIVPGNMTINCCSREPIESENLAFFVAEHLWLLRDVLQRKSIYQIGQNIGVGAPSPAGSIVAADQGDEWTATSVVIPFQLVRTGAATPLGQKVAKFIEMSLHRYPTDGPAQYDGTTPEVFHPTSTQQRGASELGQPGVDVSQEGKLRLRPPRIRGRPIPLSGSGMGES